MSTNLVFAALALVGGAAVVFQSTTNQGLLRSVGIGPALIVNTTVVLLATIVLWFVTGMKTTFFPAAASWTLYIGGLFGFTIIATAVLVFPKLGAAYAIALMVAGQCLAALVVDHYGLMAMERSPMSLQRVLGVLFVAVGVVLFQLSRPSATTP